MLTDAEIAGYMGWRGPGAYTERAMRKVKLAIAEAVARERESCAELCDELKRMDCYIDARQVADAIRNRRDV